MIYGGENGLGDLSQAVKSAVENIHPYLDKFDSIAVSGTSGLVVGAPVAVLLDKPLVVVRKKNDGSHSGRLVENRNDVGKRVLFLDDFSSSGRTRAWVRHNVLKEGGELTGEYMYYGGSMEPDTKWYSQDFLDSMGTWERYENAPGYEDEEDEEEPSW